MRARVNIGRLAKWLLGLGAVGLAATMLFAWSGLYNVAASRGHWPVVEWILRFGMENSVETHASTIPVPRLDDADLIRLGAAHFLTGCASCHGAPGAPPGVVAQQMLPPPPDLKGGRLEQWTDPQLFWIVKNGIKYTGMPAWPALGRDDEVWSVVAFLRAFPRLDVDAYRALAWGPVSNQPRDGADVAIAGGGTGSVGACARCHGAGDVPPPSALVPRLHGQPVEMLHQALRAYATGERPSGIMQPAAAALSEQALKEVAAYYAALPPLPASPMPVAEATRRLALDGDPSAEIPACQSCHNARALPIYPRLAGQNAAYIESRLRAMRHDTHERSPTQAIMMPIARRLTETQIADLAAYFAGLQP